MREMVREALAQLDADVGEFQNDLIELSRIGGVSAPGFPPEVVRRSAEATADVMRRHGIENVQVLDVPGVHPYVYGDWLHAPGAPTLLLYGHHDVQPPGRPEKWVSPPFEPEEREGRLYGRGTADDKAGVMAHVAAVSCYLRASRELPCNVKFIIEGEEEIGSEHLGEFLAAYRDRMSADFIVLSDTANLDTGLPALTYQLRGICQVDVEVQCLDHPLHSGMWGGPIPDPAQILCQIIAGLSRKDGSLDVPGLYADIQKPSRKQRAQMRRLPFDKAAFKRDAALRDGVKLAGERAYSVYERMWTRPSLTVVAMESHPIQGCSNQIVDSARAWLSLRTVPGMDGRKAGRQLVKRLTRKPPHGAQVTAEVTAVAPPWATDPEGPAFDAARRALQSGYGAPTAMIGCGGSIGFVQPFSDTLGGVPCLLMGVEDPTCNAHSENESLHLGDWVKCTRSAIYLYDELSRIEPGPKANSKKG
jgi:acetylornithine deacetylase/succinyl-diaminopimelate desuccinylase-like protein